MPLQQEPTLVLASASPRRRELVALLGLRWRTLRATVDEDAHLLEDPTLSALGVALAKARAASANLAPHEVLLAADTLVVLDERVLGKPTSAEEARQVLASLRGRAHRVLTGVALARANGLSWGAVVATNVQMRDYGDDEIARYVERGEPFDKAGGYAAQDGLFRPAERLEGCVLNVVGLPLCAVARGLETLGAPPAPAPVQPLVPPCSYCRAGEARVQVG